MNPTPEPPAGETADRDDAIAMLRECRVVAAGEHRDGLRSLTLITDGSTAYDLETLIAALSRGTEYPIADWRGRRITELLLANNREVERRRAAEARVAELEGKSK